ncbi:MAG: hypothetical protein P8L79_08400 [Rhodospirillaceae bacterium]|jgi:hypothetical protein|nr:hypothetical protein [Rhodospirillaceae bacterium]
MSDKFKSATKIRELRVVLFIVFGVGLWLFLVAGMLPMDHGGLANVPAVSSHTGTQVVATLH